MDLANQKKLAASLLNCSKKRVRFDSSRLKDIKEAITKVDIRSLINEKAITKLPKRGTSKTSTKKRKIQKAKGRRRGTGKRKGRKKARSPKKDVWMQNIRTQRELLKKLKSKDLITISVFNKMYKKAKGGFFRSRRHIKLYMEEQNLFKNK